MATWWLKSTLIVGGILVLLMPIFQLYGEYRNPIVNTLVWSIHPAFHGASLFVLLMYRTYIAFVTKMKAPQSTKCPARGR